jgi:hypothetical protein
VSLDSENLSIKINLEMSRYTVIVLSDSQPLALTIFVDGERGSIVNHTVAALQEHGLMPSVSTQQFVHDHDVQFAIDKENKVVFVSLSKKQSSLWKGALGGIAIISTTLLTNYMHTHRDRFESEAARPKKAKPKESRFIQPEKEIVKYYASWKDDDIKYEEFSGKPHVRIRTFDDAIKNRKYSFLELEFPQGKLVLLLNPRNDPPLEKDFLHKSCWELGTITANKKIILRDNNCDWVSDSGSLLMQFVNLFKIHSFHYAFRSSHKQVPSAQVQFKTPESKQQIEEVS